MDIYEENRVAVAVRESETVTRNILDNAFDAIISMDAAHDLRNPLYVIRSYSEILGNASEKISDEDRKKYLAKIFNSSEQMSNLLDNLLDFSNIESGELACTKASNA